jgi:ferredoxin
MSSYVIEKGNLASYLKHLKDKFELWVPITKGSLTHFAPYDDESEIECRSHTRTSVKTFFLPQRELMFSYTTNSEDEFAEQTISADQKVIFGVRPCDAKAMLLNARLLVDDKTNPSKDIYFNTRLQNTILIGYGCNQPGIACFCHTAGGDPFGLEGLDALVTDLGDTLLVTISEGRTSANVLIVRDIMAKATKEDLERAQQISKVAHDILVSQPKLARPVHGSNALFDLPVWEETAQRCLNCGICTYLCPTCTCFDMIDQVVDNCGQSFRCWDSCMFNLFTQHASGHNPRPGKKERVRQRFMHKLHYFPERHGGDLSCVGCGRCILYCPVNIDIREISKQMA